MERKAINGNELVSVTERLGEYRVEQTCKMTERFLAVQDELSDTTSKSCPCCGNTTSFHMRQKLLAFLEKAEEENMLNGLIEEDETYVLEFQKDICATHHQPEKHGETATKWGISNEQLCGCVAADRDGSIVAKCVDRAKPSAENIVDAIGKQIEEKSVFQCDGATAYKKLVAEKQCVQVVLNAHADYNKVYHLNTINCLHSWLKDLLKHFNGVSTRYFNHYLAMFAALE